jgi:hypothetical protein
MTPPPNDLLSDLLRTLSGLETAQQLRQAALRTSGVFLSPYLLVNPRTGDAVSTGTLRTLLKRAYSGFGHTPWRIPFWGVEKLDKEDLFVRHFRVGLQVLNQRRVTIGGGTGPLRAPTLSRTDLAQLRVRLMRKDPLLRGTAGVLVLFDTQGRERLTMEDIGAARYAVHQVYAQS